jgi:transposase
MKCGPDGCPILAFSDLTPAEQRVQRKRTAEKMYKQGFTQEQIAKQLGVSDRTISEDLRGFEVTSKPPRPKGGRPKGSKRENKRGKETPKLDKARDVIRGKIEANEPINTNQLAKEHGVSHVTFDMAITAEVARKEAFEEKIALDPSHLSKTAQKKLDAAVHAHKRVLDAKFDAAVRDEIKKRIDEIVLPHWKKQIEEAKTLYERRRGLMNKDTFNMIRRALHPDSRNSISESKLAAAFDAFMALEKYLLDEKNSPTEFGHLPNTWADWEAAKQKATAERRARRAANYRAVSR